MLTNKVTNHFACDAPGCAIEFDYNPSPQAPEVWPAGVQVALQKVVAVVHPISNFTRFFCCKEHAIEAIQNDLHLPPLPPKVVPATTEAEVKAAAAGSRAVAEMKGPRVKAR